MESSLAHRLFLPLDGKLAREPVALRGAGIRDWKSKTTIWGSVDGRGIRWQGILRGPPATVALGWLETPSELRWARLERTHEDRIRLGARMTVGSVPEAGVSLVLRTPTAMTEPSLLTRPADAEAEDAVQGLARAEGSTGECWPILSVPGDPPVRGGVVLFAKRDVRFRRKGLWGVRPELAEGLPEPLASIVVSGRWGTVRPPDLPV